MVAETITGPTLHIIVPVIVGIIIALMEVYFITHDEGSASMGQVMGDISHSAAVCIAGTLIACNVPLLVSQAWFPEFARNWLFINAAHESWVISLIVTLIVKIKMVVHHAVIKGLDGQNEKFIHMILIAALVGFSPYYIFILYDKIPFFDMMAANVKWLPL